MANETPPTLSETVDFDLRAPEAVVAEIRRERITALLPHFDLAGYPLGFELGPE